MKRLLATLVGLSVIAGTGSASAATGTTADTPWAVTADTTVKEQNLIFASGDAQLSGTLYYPEGGRNLPAVVILHGASEPSRGDAIYTHLKQMLPPLGIAVFAFDRRGTGKSSGAEHGKQDFDLLAQDGVAALRTLQKDSRIDPHRVGFWGLSQGGGLALLATQKEPQTAFAIAVSPLISTADVQMNFASENIMRIKGYPQSEIDQALATRHAIDDYDRGKIDLATVERILDDAEAKPWFKEIYLGRSMIAPNADWRVQINTDPMKSLNGSLVPTLIIFGQQDVWIPVRDALRKLDATKAYHANVNTTIVTGATHEMMLGVDPKDEINPASFGKFAPNAPEYFAVMSAWLAERGIARTDGKLAAR